MPDFGKVKVNLSCKGAAKMLALLLIGICAFGIVPWNEAAVVCYAKTDTDKEKVEEFVTAYYEAHTAEGIETLPDYVEDAESTAGEMIAEEMLVLEVCLGLGVEKYDNLDVIAYPLSDGISWLAVVSYELIVEDFDIGIPGLISLMVRKQEDGTFKIWDEYLDNMDDTEREKLEEEIWEIRLSDEIYDKTIDVYSRYNTIISENSDILEWVLNLQDEITQAYVEQMEDSYEPKTEADPGIETEAETETIETYIVREGDCLWSIAEAELGDGIYWSSIYEANRELIGDDPNLIYVGWELEIDVNVDSAAIDDSIQSNLLTETISTSVEKKSDWRRVDYADLDRYPSYYFFSNAYQWAYHLNNESAAATIICAYAEDDSEEGTWELCDMHTRFTDQRWAGSFFARSDKGRELYILWDVPPYADLEYLVMADGIQGADGSYSYDSSLAWKTYKSQLASSAKKSGYTIYVSTDAYIYDSTYINEGVNAMSDYLESIQADQNMKWWLLADSIYIGKKGYLADMSFSNGFERVHMMIDIRNRQYSIAEVYDTQEKGNIIIDLHAQADWDDLYLGGAEADFFVNAFQWHYDPQAEKAAACAVKDYAEKIGLEDEEWELTHMYSEDGTVGVAARAKSPDRRLSLLIKGNTYQVIADVHKGDSGEYDLSDGYYSYDSEMKWNSYYEWTINGEKENEFVYTVHCNEEYYQHDSIYEYQLNRAMQEYLSSINADIEEEWEMLPEKLFVGCYGSLADAWYANGNRRVHLVVDVWNKTYTVIVGEDS